MTQFPKVIINKRKEKTMNPLTQFKKLPILSLLIAPALVALTATPALATPNCGVITENLFTLDNL
jgi:hypothetical protein